MKDVKYSNKLSENRLNPIINYALIFKRVRYKFSNERRYKNSCIFHDSRVSFCYAFTIAKYVLILIKQVSPMSNNTYNKEN